MVKFKLKYHFYARDTQLYDSAQNKILKNYEIVWSAKLRV